MLKKHLFVSVFTIVLFASCFKTAYYMGTSNEIDIVFEPVPKDTVTMNEVEIFKPNIEMVDNTHQRITKGGITIDCEVVPIKVTEKDVYNDPYPSSVDPISYKKHSFDRFCQVSRKQLLTYPSNVRFKINIRNNSGKILRMHQLGLALLIDGVVYDQPEGFTKAWDAGMILNGFDKEYEINGPDLNGIGDQKVMAILIQDVPTEYNQAGDKTKVETFEWFFKIKLNKELVAVPEKYTYFNRDVPFEICSKCKGLSYFYETKMCDKCSGKGVRYNLISGQYYTCGQCQGNKVYDYKMACDNHGCEEGKIYHPLSYPTKTISDNSYSISKYKIKVLGATGKPIYIKDYTGGSAQYKQYGVLPCDIIYQTSDKELNPSFYILDNGKKYYFSPNSFGSSFNAKIKIKFTNGNIKAKGATFQFKE